MRCFVSVPVPENAREHLDAYLELRRHAEPSLRWSAADRWHVTLAFLPDVAEVDLDDLCERLESAGQRRRPIDMRLRGGGVFGGATSARVLWADVESTPDDREELDRVAVGVRHAAAASGTVVEGGKFVPHVTLARSPRPMDVRHLLDVLDLYEGPTWQADTVHLVASDLSGPGVRHETLGTYRLGPPPEEDKWWRR